MNGRDASLTPSCSYPVFLWTRKNNEEERKNGQEVMGMGILSLLLFLNKNPLLRSTPLRKEEKIRRRRKEMIKIVMRRCSSKAFFQ